MPSHRLYLSASLFTAVLSRPLEPRWRRGVEDNLSRLYCCFQSAGDWL